VSAGGATRCVIYTRKSSEEGLEQSFNSLHAQREACEAYVKSQIGEGWRLRRDRYDDGGYSGASMDRPALRMLLAEVAARRVDVVVVYKVDRLTRSLTDFAKIIEAFDRAGVSFVSVTQAFNTTTSMGRLTLNVLLSFAQFEREVTGERIRDKIAASKAKGMWMGGVPPLGYDVPTSPVSRALVVNEVEAEKVRRIFWLYLGLGNTYALQQALRKEGIRPKGHRGRGVRRPALHDFSRGAIQHLLRNRTYLGEIIHKDQSYPGRHPAIVDERTFAAAQQLLDQARHKRRVRVPKAATAPLSGLIFDGSGQAMELVVSGGAKKRVHRYYVAPPAWPGANASGDDDAIRRVPAAAVEDLVIQRIAPIAQLTEDELKDGAIRSIVSRIEVHPSTVDMVLRLKALATASGGRLGIESLRRWLRPAEQVTVEPHDARLIRIVLPVRLKLRGGRNWISGPDGQVSLPVGAPDNQAIERIRSAHAVLRACGAQPDAPNSLLRYARAPKSSHQMNQLRWAFLAPDIQHAILEGRARAPGGDGSMDGKSIPLLWSEQREMFHKGELKQGGTRKLSGQNPRGGV
jgi:site-specific DNA recombinase